MATKIKTLAVLLFYINCVHSGAFDDALDSTTKCKHTCKDTYTPHTYDKSTAEESCNRGCRLYSAMEFMYEDCNKTKQGCFDACTEAYKKTDELEACKMGCESQEPWTPRWSEEYNSVQNIHLVNPIDYVHQIYSSLISNVMSQSWSSWAVYMRDNDGSIVVVKSPTVYRVDIDFNSVQNIHLVNPIDYVHQIYSSLISNVMSQSWSSWAVYMRDNDGSIVVVKSPTVYRVDIADEKEDEQNTDSIIETNILPLDNSATPFLKYSHLKGQLDNDDIINLAQRDLSTDENRRDYSSNDWLSCIANKTGLPRLILSWLLLMCAIVMIWLCLSAAVTGPDQRVVSEPQKLSINGDQEVMAELLANGIKPVYPQEGDEECNILPLKIKVMRI